MSNRSSAAITIGGRLHQTAVAAFLAAIEADHLCVDYDDTPIGEADIRSGFPLHGAANEVRDGEFPLTEAFCRDHGLRYVRRSDACAGAWDPSIEIYTDTIGRRGFDATSNGTVMITLEDVRRLGSLAAIEAHFAAADYDPGPLLIVEDDGEASPAIG